LVVVVTITVLVGVLFGKLLDTVWLSVSVVVQLQVLVFLQAVLTKAAQTAITRNFFMALYYFNLQSLVVLVVTTTVDELDALV